MNLNTNNVFLDVDKKNIDSSVKIFNSSRICGKLTSIGPNCIIGEEGPVVLENCQLGNGVQLKGGYFKDSVFLDGSSMGSGAHIRRGTLLEEQASGAHCVGFKQTILFPFVTTGSLINFCDAFISGGTDRNNHSEIGSSYVHFNYTLDQDKATASLFGNVSEGVFLNKNPIFLGGQGGAVGPLQIAFGSKVAAGSILRRNYLNPDQLISEPHIKEFEKDFILDRNKKSKEIIQINLTYMGNLAALYNWYTHIRSLFIKDVFDKAVIEGAKKLLSNSFQERKKQLDRFIINSCENNLNQIIKSMQLVLTDAPEQLISSINSTNDYLTEIKNVDTEVQNHSVKWMNDIIDTYQVMTKD